MATMKEIGIKVLCGAVVAMASGIGSILGSEGAKAGLKALQEGAKKKPKDLADAYETEANMEDLQEIEEVEPETEGDGA